nr:pectate lyase [Streptomyces sp. SBT349]
MRFPHRFLAARRGRMLLAAVFTGALLATGTTAVAQTAGAESPASAPVAAQAAPAADALAVQWPQPAGDVVVNETIEVSGTFDGGNKRYIPGPDLGDGGQGEDQLPVFELSSGETLRNVIIGSPGADGVHCSGSCTLDRVWWENIGEDAATFRGGSGSQFLVTGGAARASDDKVLQRTTAVER